MTSELFLFSLAVGAGVDPLRLLLLFLCLFAPWLLAVAFVALFWLGSRVRRDSDAVFCEGVGAELRAGSSLRQAVAAAALAVGKTDLAAVARQSGIDQVGRALAGAFPAIGREVSFAFSGAARSGAPPAELFDELASLAMANEEVRREVRVASAPGRATASVLLGAPAAYLGVRWAGGDLAGLLATPGQRGVAAAGAALFVTGLACSLFVLGRAR